MAGKTPKQIEFDLFTGYSKSIPEIAAEETPDVEEEDENSSRATVKRHLRRAALRWLVNTQRPAGAATQVVTRIARVRADVAAYWSVPVKNVHDEGPAQILQPQKTVIIQCYAEREECWPDCLKSAEMLPHLCELKEELRETQTVIRTEEPELKDAASLFEEYADWHYEKSSNRHYHKLKREIEKTEHALYAGTKFDRIRSARLADELYLAVPANTVAPEELAEGWGLIWVDNELNATVVAEPQNCDCLASNRIHLIQNIAAAALENVLFANGLRETVGELAFVTIPRGHRKPRKPRLGQ